MAIRHAVGHGSPPWALPGGGPVAALPTLMGGGAIQTLTPIATPIADPLLLAVASGQVQPGSLPATMEATAAGSTYVDPTSGVTVLRLTDSGAPSATTTRAWANYSDGGPHISLQWQDAGQRYYTLSIMATVNGLTEQWLVDVTYPGLVVSNWRQTASPDLELTFAFSMNPATPRVGYVIFKNSRAVIRKYDTAAMAELVEGIFPRAIAGESRLSWLHVSINDAWIAFQEFIGSPDTQYALRPSDDTLRSWAPSGYNEGHLDRAGGYIYVVRTGINTPCYGPTNVMDVYDLSDGSQVAVSPGVATWPAGCQDTLFNTHIIGLRGRVVTRNPNGATNNEDNSEYNYVPSTDVLTLHKAPLDGINSSAHRCGQWWVNNNGGVLAAQWYGVSSNGDAGGGPAFGNRAIGLINTNPALASRFLCHHGGTLSSYEAQTKFTQSQDGLIGMFVSDMDGSGRHDVFVVKMPTS